MGVKTFSTTSSVASLKNVPGKKLPLLKISPLQNIGAGAGFLKKARTGSTY
jgi:hypothetical protein